MGLHIVRLDGLGKDKLFLLVNTVFCEKLFQHFAKLQYKCLTSLLDSFLITYCLSKKYFFLLVLLYEDLPNGCY